jgi:uncharacterized protein with PIN domain
MPTTAKNYTKGRNGNTIDILVIHSAENQELPGQAKHLVQWFAGATAPQASAHVMIDNKTFLTSVDDSDIAWAVDDFPLNQCSKSYELTGHAAQTTAQWNDPYSKGVLHQAVLAFKADMKKYGIPAKRLTDAEIVAKHKNPKDKKIKGICTHGDISRALKIKGGHTDPGINFPMSQFLADLAKE